jgi:hypothetical protein
MDLTPTEICSIFTDVKVYMGKVKERVSSEAYKLKKEVI